MSSSEEGDVCQKELELDELCAFVDDTDSWIDQTLSTLGWTRERVIKTDNHIECPVNAGHSVAHQTLDKHVKYCKLTSKGYTKKEIDAEQSTKFCYAHSPLVVSIDLDEAALRNILETAGAAAPCDLPATMSRSLTALSPAQRRRIYEYCVEVARSTNTSSHIADEDLTLLEDTRSERPLSNLEIMAKMRDMKRRRQSYRGKTTHTANKNYTEVIRDVLGNQMELLTNLWADEAKEKEQKRRQEERKQRDRHSASVDRHTHRKRSRSKSRERSSGRHRSASKDPSRHSQRQDDDRRHHRSLSRKTKHSRSRSRSRGHRKKHKRSRNHSPQKEQEQDRSTDTVSAEIVRDSTVTQEQS